MNVKILILAAGFAFGTFGAANAQTAEQQATIDAQIASTAAICSATPAECAFAVQAALAALSAAGISGAALDSALGGLATALTQIGASLPPAAQVQISSALQVVADASPVGSPLALALAEIITALATGNGAAITALLPSAN